PSHSLTHSQVDGDPLRRPLTLALAEEVEPERADALRQQQGCQSLVRPAVLVGKEAVTEHGDAVCLFLRRRQDSRDRMPRRVRERQRFFHTGILTGWWLNPRQGSIIGEWLTPPSAFKPTLPATSSWMPRASTATPARSWRRRRSSSTANTHP